MGDELGLLNDASYLDDPHRRDDNRWMHRPAMDWEAAERRHDPASVEGRLWTGLQRLIAARRATRAIHVQGVDRAAVDRQRPRLRRSAASRRARRCWCVANFTADPQPCRSACSRPRASR